MKTSRIRLYGKLLALGYPIPLFWSRKINKAIDKVADFYFTKRTDKKLRRPRTRIKAHEF